MNVFNRVPAAGLTQLYSDTIHMAGAIVVTICVTALAWAGKIPADITGAVFTGVIGYVAGHAGSAGRNTPTRTGDGNTRVSDTHDAGG